MLYYRQVPNLSQTNLNEIYASQTASIERGGHPDMEFLQGSSSVCFPLGEGHNGHFLKSAAGAWH